MAVLASNGRVVRVGMVPVVMAMRVVVREWRVNVKMTVILGQMQVYAEREANRCHGRPRARWGSAEKPSGARAHERRGRKD